MRPSRALLALALLSIPMSAAVSARGEGDPPSYLILPFENIAEDRSLEWLSTGLALALGEYLQGLGADVVDPEQRAVLLEGNGIPSGARITLATVLDLSRKMRARTGGERPERTILGRFNVTDGDLTLSVRAIDLDREQAGEWLTAEGRLKDLLVVHERVAGSLARSEARLRAPRRGRSSRTAEDGPPLLAFETYSRAMAETDSDARLRLLQRAVHEYPDYHRAAYQAAVLLAKTENWGPAAEMLAKASGDPRPYEFEFHLLTARVALGRKDAAAAAEAAERALSIRDSARAHLVLGKASLALGDQDAARSALRKASAVDPSDPDLLELQRALEASTESEADKP